MKLFKNISLLALIFSLSCTKTSPTRLPFFGPKKLAVNGDTLYHQIGSFNLINQYKDTLSETIFNHKVTVVNFFFATCKTICPVMSKHLMHLQDSCIHKNQTLDLLHRISSDNTSKKLDVTLASQPKIQFISITVNPAYDQPEVLLNYANTYKAKKGFWNFLTGSKEQIYALAKNDFLVNALENTSKSENTAYTPSSEEFIHSELMMLIDSNRRIRGLYNGTDASSMLLLWNDLKQLQIEP